MSNHTPAPVITKRSGGEYSTTALPDGAIETVWFPDDPNEKSYVVDRTRPLSLVAVSVQHIMRHEAVMAR